MVMLLSSPAFLTKILPLSEAKQAAAVQNSLPCLSRLKAPFKGTLTAFKSLESKYVTKHPRSSAIALTTSLSLARAETATVTTASGLIPYLINVLRQTLVLYSLSALEEISRPATTSLGVNVKTLPFLLTSGRIVQVIKIEYLSSSHALIYAWESSFSDLD